MDEVNDDLLMIDKPIRKIVRDVVVMTGSLLLLALVGHEYGHPNIGLVVGVVMAGLIYVGISANDQARADMLARGEESRHKSVGLTFIAKTIENLTREGGKGKAREARPEHAAAD